MINYRGKPVLGPDSSTKNTSEFFALAGTVLFWLLFMIFSFVIKPQPKKQYKEVQIVLSSTPVVQKSEESPAPAEQAASSAAAAEENLIDFEKRYLYCDGAKMIPGVPNPIRCHQEGGHDSQTFQEALTNSCNPAFIDIGWALGEDKFVYYCDAFGLV